MKLRAAILSTIFSFFLFAGVSFAESESELGSLISAASKSLVEIAKAKETQIPDTLLRDCDAIVIIPEMYKAGFIVGGSMGNGIISVRDRNTGEWSSPAFIQIASASFGWQVGVERAELVLVIVGRNAVDMFLQESFKLGADASIAAGPVGRKGQAAIDYKLNQIYSYSKTQGLFAGVSLEGSIVGIQHGFNGTYYGTGTTPHDILIKQNVHETNRTMNLKIVLDTYIK